MEVGFFAPGALGRPIVRNWSVSRRVAEARGWFVSLFLGQESQNLFWRRVQKPVIARQAGRLAYVHAFGNLNLWRADLRAPKAPPVRVIASTRTENQPDYS